MDTKSSYVKVASYEAKQGEVKKVLLLYSGGLDTSVMLKWIQDQYKVQVITLTLDIGQQKDDLEAVRQKALKFGAIKAIVHDAKEEFADDVLAKGIKANADYQGGYHLSTPMGRVIIARAGVKYALSEGADCIAHGCTGKGNDQVRFEGYILTNAPQLKVMAPVREWNMDRDEEIEYAKKNNIPVPASVDFPYSVDDNMWGMTWEGGEIEEPDVPSLSERFLTTYTLPKNAPNEEEIVTLSFKKGLPVKLNGEDMKLAELIRKLNLIGGKHGVGVAHIFEDRLVGLKNGGVYEQPAGRIIITAHKALERFVSTRNLNELKDVLDIKWAYLCYGALWYDPTMDALNALNDNVNEYVSGEVQVKLFKGTTTIHTLKSPYGLAYTSFNTNEGYKFNVNASTGFTEIYTLQMRLAKARNKKE